MKWFWTAVSALAGLGWAYSAVALDIPAGVRVGLSVAVIAMVRQIIEQHEPRPK